MELKLLTCRHCLRPHERCGHCGEVIGPRATETGPRWTCKCGREGPTRWDAEALANELHALREVEPRALRMFSTRLTMLSAHLEGAEPGDAHIVLILARLLYVVGCEGERG